MPVILKKHYSQPITDVDVEIPDRLRAGRVRSFIHVVPTQRKLRDVHRAYVRATQGGISPAFHLFTLETLASKLAAVLCSPRQLVDGPAQAVVMNEAIQSVRSSLEYFRFRRGYKLPKGTFQKIINVINKLKERGVYLSVLHQEVEGAENDEKQKLRDILLIYEEYERKLGSQFIDPAGRIKGVNEYWFHDAAGATSTVKKHFDSVDTLFVSGFDEFSDPELTMLEHLSHIPSLGTVISFDYHAGNEEIFGHLRENYEKFLGFGFTKVWVPSVNAPTFSAHIVNHLFRYDSSAERFEASKFVTLFDAEDREKEIQLVAKLIKHLAVQRPDRDLSKICVAAFQPQRYANLIREVFAQYGIPANVTDRYSLDQSQVVVSLLSLLAIHQNNFRLTDIMRALASPYFALSDDRNYPVDAGNLYEASAKLKITVGRSTWEHRIDRQLETLAKEIDNVDDDIEEERLRRERVMLQKAKRDIMRVAALLSRFDEKMSPLDFKRHVVELLDEIRVVERIMSVPRDLIDDEQLEKDVRAYQAFVSFLDEFLGILALEYSGNDVREPLSFYMERLRAAIPQVRYNIRQKYGYGVQVTSFNETRGLSFEIMIMIGIVDGEIPPVYQPEIFFSNARREKKERYHLTEHRYLFYQALTNCTEHLYLTVPRHDNETPLVSSTFVDALLKSIVLDDCRGELPAVLTEPIYSEGELLQHLGSFISTEDDASVHSELARYPDITETLDHMRRAIAVEKSRIENSRAMPEYNGRIAQHLSADALAALERFRHRVYSVTQLESYGNCPFQFFADKVLRLRVIPEVEEGVSPLERGGVLHEVLFEFYSGRREQQRTSLAGCSDEEFQSAVQDLVHRARLRLDALAAFDIFWDVEKELILGAKNRKGILEEFLQKERASTLAVEPKYFEAAFGSKVGSKRKTDPSLTSDDPIIAGNVQLRGKIDRIDAGGKVFTVIDYKTGSKLAGKKEIELGMSLQLPIYLYAVERMLAETAGRNLTGAAGVYFQLKSPVKAKLGIGNGEFRDTAFEASPRSGNLLSTAEELQRIIDKAIAYVNAYVDGIARGEFPVEPKDPVTVCRRCAFQTICRIKSRVVTEQTDDTTEDER